MACMAMLATVSLTMTWLSHTGGPLWAMYVCLTLVGVTRAFQQPSKAALLPLIVPRTRFTNAVTWSTGGFHLAAILGPALGGLLIAWTGRAWIVYFLDAVLACLFLSALWRISTPHQQRMQSEPGWQALVVGLRFVYLTRVMFAALTLDMFAVLLGGATTLLPVYAEDILRVGPSGFGWMRAMPALGALLMSFVIAHLPPMQKAGRALLWSVVGFGVATVVFGVSRNFGLSLLTLFLIGAVDNISVVIRHTLVQMLTPDEMRGRVSAVNSMFIGASNELGGFESGLVAEYTSPTFSVVSGGIGTLIVVTAVALRFPELVIYGPLTGQPRALAEHATRRVATPPPTGQATDEPALPRATPHKSARLIGTDSGSEQ
jgi:MFS family permease